MVKLLCAGATFITGRSTSTRTTFTLRSQIHFPIQPELPDMRLRKCWGVSNTTFDLCLYFQNLRYKSLSFIMISNWHTVMMVCVKSQTEEQQKKFDGKLKKKERGWKRFLFFPSLLDPGWWLSVICLCLQIIFWTVTVTLQYLKIFEREPRLRIERGAKCAQVIFSNVDKPWWQTASWWRQGRSGCQRSIQPPHCGKGEAASASPAETSVFSSFCVYHFFVCKMRHDEIMSPSLYSRPRTSALSERRNGAFQTPLSCC